MPPATLYGVNDKRELLAGLARSLDEYAYKILLEELVALSIQTMYRTQFQMRTFVGSVATPGSRV